MSVPQQYFDESVFSSETWPTPVCVCVCLCKCDLLCVTFTVYLQTLTCVTQWSTAVNTSAWALQDHTTASVLRDNCCRTTERDAAVSGLKSLYLAESHWGVNNRLISDLVVTNVIRLVWRCSPLCFNYSTEVNRPLWHLHRRWFDQISPHKMKKSSVDDQSEKIKLRRFNKSVWENKRSQTDVRSRAVMSGRNSLDEDDHLNFSCPLGSRKKLRVPANDFMEICGSTDARITL